MGGDLEEKLNFPGEYAIEEVLLQKCTVKT
jgi:hypothetical protein